MKTGIRIKFFKKPYVCVCVYIYTHTQIHIQSSSKKFKSEKALEAYLFILKDFQQKF